MGRIFIIRLHDGDHLPDVLEEFAEQQKIASAFCLLVGGIKEQGRVVVGPKDGYVLPVEPMSTLLSGVSEVAGVGTIFQNEEGKPKLHMHASFGRGEKVVTGCVRLGVDVWKIGEVIVIELADSGARRVLEKGTGFELLEVQGSASHPETS
ncbi:MAG: DNA-binding protein [Candidatus Bathyarchaeota archaeon]|nr:DNA-binding protein [Candidatus Bathyarchaeota archaeon]